VILAAALNDVERVAVNEARAPVRRLPFTRV
jgi:hypothetical protein